MAKPLLGADIGGTNIRMAALTPAGQVLSAFSFPTPKTPAKIRDQVCSVFNDWMQTRGCECIGIGIAGLVDRKAGTVSDSYNLWGARTVAVADAFEKKLGVRPVLEKDANAWAFASYQTANPKPASLAFLTFGSGVGCGLVWNGMIVHGVRFASEFCYSIISSDRAADSAGISGSVEAMASRQAVMRLARQKGFGKTTPQQLDALSRAGNARARSVLETTGRFAGISVANLVYTLQPSCVELGGGLCNSRVFVSELEKTVKKRVLPRLLKGVCIQKTRLDAFGGAIGAALWAAQATSGDLKTVL